MAESNEDIAIVKGEQACKFFQTDKDGFTRNLVSIEFIPDIPDDFKFIVTKSSFVASQPPQCVKITKPNERIKSSMFLAFRDTYTKLSINSTCTGILRFNFIAKSWQKIKQKRDKMLDTISKKEAIESQLIMTHMAKYIRSLDLANSTNWNNWPVIHEKLWLNFEHGKYNTEMLALLGDRKQLYDTILINGLRSKNFKDQQLNSCYDMILGFTITSDVETVCIIMFDGRFDIKIPILQGSHFYPCFLPTPSAFFPFSTVTISFQDAITDIQYKGIHLPTRSKIGDGRMLLHTCGNTYMLVNGMIAPNTENACQPGCDCGKPDGYCSKTWEKYIVGNNIYYRLIYPTG